ncbi:MAG: flavodoxin [Oscillospiraceae bacterium]|nr:flavodoxin [Oscillospiraceae bacterium]
MSKIAVVYWSSTGNTEAMAQQVAAGAEAAGAESSLIQAAEFDAGQAAAYTAIAFGCPAMGCEQLEDAEFEPMFSAVAPALAGKPIALFGSYGWGDGEWMRSWEETARSAGAALAAESVICCESPDDDAQAACRALGETLAKA